MPTVEANGQTLYYEVHTPQGGTGGEQGDPLLCVMGLGAHSGAWVLQVQPFSERHRTVVFDNRDAGRSSIADSQYEVRDMAADTLALADALELDRFHLLGVSMGGAIAQEVALAAPDRISTLTLAVTYARWGAWGRRPRRRGAPRRMKLTHEEHVDELMLNNFSESFFENEEIVEYVRGQMLAEPRRSRRRPSYASSPPRGATTPPSALPSLSMPVQVLGVRARPTGAGVEDGRAGRADAGRPAHRVRGRASRRAGRAGRGVQPRRARLHRRRGPGAGLDQHSRSRIRERSPAFAAAIASPASSCTTSGRVADQLERARVDRVGAACASGSAPRRRRDLSDARETRAPRAASARTTGGRAPSALACRPSIRA